MNCNITVFSYGNVTSTLSISAQTSRGDDYIITVELQRGGGTYAALPDHMLVPPLGAAKKNRYTSALLTVLCMFSTIRFADPPRAPNTQADHAKPLEPLVTRPKATFQWPPDCLWPFVDQKADSDR